MHIEPKTERTPGDPGDRKSSRAAYSDGPRLLADIGATHARFALESAPGVLRNVAVLLCDDYSGIVPLLNAYLAQAQAETGGVRISHGAFALANPISGDFIRMTNRAWEFSTEEVRRALGLTTLLIVNDFTALAMALPGFKPEQLMQVGGGTPQSNAVSGVLGPGTGPGRVGRDPDRRRLRHARLGRRPRQLRAGRRARIRDPAICLARVPARVERTPDFRPRHGNHLSRAGPAQRQASCGTHRGRDHRRRARTEGRAVPRGARMLLRHAGRRRGQPGGHVGRLRRHLHRRRHRAAPEGVVQGLAIPRAASKPRAASPTTWRRSRPM